MKFVILACLAAVALARPQVSVKPEYIATLRDERVDNGDGTFNYLFETENGIYTEARGNPAANGGQAITGSFRFPLDDGTIVEVTYTADERGYQPESSAIPTPHPLPAHVIETLALVDELVRQGAKWDDQGRRINRKK